MSSPLDPLPDSEWSPATASHLLWRAGLGGTPAEVEQLHQRGLKGAVDFLLNQFGPDDTFLDAVKDTSQEEATLQNQMADKELSGKERNKLGQELGRLRREKIRGIRDGWTSTILQTKRPFLERLTLFWHNYFAVTAEKVDDPVSIDLHLRLLRSRGLGNFGELLLSVAKDPAMLRHLDNINNRKGHPNENFARELMELFSMGIGNYTEKDVLESARAFTGWTFNPRTHAFEARANDHDNGEKTFLGQKGNWDGAEIIGIIIAHPASSRFLARKIWDWFAYEDAERRIIEFFASEIRLAAFDLRAIFQKLFMSREFYSTRARGARVKDPLLLVLSSVRLLQMPAPPVDLLTETMRVMGEELLFPPDVNGWPMGKNWINTSTLLMRYNFSNYLTHGDVPGFTRRQEGTAAFKPDGFVALIAEKGIDDPPKVVDFFVAWFIQRPIAAAPRQQLIDYLQTDKAGGSVRFDLKSKSAGEKLRGLIHLIMSSPDYQLC